MREREVKLTLPSGTTLPAPESLVDGLGDWSTEQVDQHATYFDTPDLALTRAGASLRYRSDDGWTVKIPRPRDGATFVRDEYRFAARGHAIRAIHPRCSIISSQPHDRLAYARGRRDEQLRTSSRSLSDDQCGVSGSTSVTSHPSRRTRTCTRPENARSRLATRSKPRRPSSANAPPGRSGVSQSSKASSATTRTRSSPAPGCTRPPATRPDRRHPSLPATSRASSTPRELDSENNGLPRGSVPNDSSISCQPRSYTAAAPLQTMRAASAHRRSRP
jgi:hypothetical protein